MKNPSRPGSLRKRKLFRTIFGVFSLSGILFVFQACYGSPEDFGQDVLIQGTVTSADNNANLAKIRVEINETGQYTYTATDGTYQMWCERMRQYRLVFSDPLNPREVRHATCDTTLLPPPDGTPSPELTVNIKLR